MKFQLSLPSAMALKLPARAISRETGCAVYQLDMIMSGDGTGIQPYLDAMQKNIDTIAEALG